MTLNKLMTLCAIARNGHTNSVKCGTTSDDEAWLRSHGYIDGPSGGVMDTTEKGKAHINAALNEGLIVQKWIPAS